MDKFVVPAALITAAIILLTEGIKSIGARAGMNISGKAAMIAAVVVGVGVGMLQAWLPTLPIEQQAAIAQVLVTAGAIIMAFGGNDLLKSFAPSDKPSASTITQTPISPAADPLTAGLPPNTTLL